MSKNCMTYIHRTVWKWHRILIHSTFGSIDILDIYITIWIQILQFGYIYILQFGHIDFNLDINMEIQHIYIWLFNILILFDKHAWRCNLRFLLTLKKRYWKKAIFSTILTNLNSFMFRTEFLAKIKYFWRALGFKFFLRKLDEKELKAYRAIEMSLNNT